VAWSLIVFLFGLFLAFTVYFYLDIAGLAPQASYSFSAAKKSNQKRPPQQLRPVNDTGFPFSHYRYHAVPELAHVRKHVRSDNWHRKPMITAPPKWLAEVD